MFKKLAKLVREFATKVVLEVSIEALKKLGIREQVAEELIETGVFEETEEEMVDFEIVEEEVQDEIECQEDDEDRQDTYIITKNYDILPVHGAEKGTFALCVQVVNLSTGKAYWMPYRFVQQKTVEQEALE